MIIKQLSVFIENKGGRLSEITNILAEKNINIRALSLADTTNFGILRLIVDEPTNCYNELKNAGFTVTITDVIGVALADEPGALSIALKILAKSNISVEYIYAFLGAKQNKAYVIIRVEDNESAIKTLRDASYNLLDNTGEIVI